MCRGEAKVPANSNIASLTRGHLLPQPHSISIDHDLGSDREQRLEVLLYGLYGAAIVSTGAGTHSQRDQGRRDAEKRFQRASSLRGPSPLRK